MNCQCVIQNCQNFACFYCDCELLICGEHKIQHSSLNPIHKLKEIYSKVQPRIKASLLADMDTISNNLNLLSNDFMLGIASLHQSIDRFFSNFISNIHSLTGKIKRLQCEMSKVGYHLNESHVAFIENLMQLKKIQFKECKAFRMDFIKGFVVDSVIGDANKFIEGCCSKIKKLVCEACGSNQDTLLRGCGHMGCLKCIRKAEVCGKCFADYGEKYVEIYCSCGSNRKICTYCTNRICPRCTPNKSLCESCCKMVSNCVNCGQSSTPVTLMCKHLGCTSCESQKLCKECSELYKFCKNCKRLCFMTADFKCGHVGCEKCITSACEQCAEVKPVPQPQMKRPISVYEVKEPEAPICENCGIVSNNYVRRECGHFSCNICSKDYCRTCSVSFGKVNYCKNCGQKAEKALLSCKHDGCFKCVVQDYCKICRCENCGRDTHRKTRLTCGHAGCEACNDAPCNNCLQSTARCHNCNKPNIRLIQLKCSHLLCQTCITKSPDCRLCCKSNEIRCTSCKKLTDSFFTLSCAHNICLACYQTSPVCTLCSASAKSSPQINCKSCNRPCVEHITLICQHSICLQCFSSHNSEDSCKACETQKKCSNCSNTNIAKLQRCSHTLCESCINKLVCYKCEGTGQQIICSCCEKVVLGVTQLLCGHSGCFKCIQERNNCKKCMQLICVNCKESQEEMLSHPCGHIVCIECDRNNLPCAECVTEQSHGIKCMACCMNEASSQFKCGHMICKACKGKSVDCPRCNKVPQDKAYLLCENCSEQCTEVKKFNCGHNGCSTCRKNEYCFGCSFVRKKFIPKTTKPRARCVDCDEKVDLYSYLYCGHACCNQCLKSTYAYFNYCCKSCIFSLKKNCVTCKNKASWLQIENTAFANCCNRRICLNCMRVVEGNQHRCSSSIFDFFSRKSS